MESLCIGVLGEWCLVPFYPLPIVVANAVCRHAVEECFLEWTLVLSAVF